MMNVKPSILISVFRRKGGESKYTSIINDDVKKLNYDLLAKLAEHEICLIAYYKNHKHWCMITDRRLVGCMGDYKLDLAYSQIAGVEIAMDEEFKERVMDKNRFTRSSGNIS